MIDYVIHLGACDFDRKHCHVSMRFRSARHGLTSESQAQSSIFTSTQTSQTLLSSDSGRAYDDHRANQGFVSFFIFTSNSHPTHLFSETKSCCGAGEAQSELHTSLQDSLYQSSLAPLALFSTTQRPNGPSLLLNSLKDHLIQPTVNGAYRALRYQWPIPMKNIYTMLPMTSTMQEGVAMAQGLKGRDRRKVEESLGRTRLGRRRL